VLLLFIASIIYGSFRISQVESETTEGPGISLVQPNFTFPRRPGQNNEQALFDLTRIAATQSEIVVVPETALNSQCFETFNKEKPELSSYGQSWLWDVQNSDKESVMQYLIGGSSLTTDEENPSLNDLKYKLNSGLLIAKNGDILDDYAKIGLVPIGEFVPFAGKFSDSWKILGPIFLGFVILFIIFLLVTKKRMRERFSLRVRIIVWVFVFTGLYVSIFVTLSSHLKDLIVAGYQSAGFGDEYIPNDKPGEKNTKFKVELTSTGEAEKGAQKYIFATPICYEIGYPHIVRNLANSDDVTVDFMLNLSNDNFYRKSAELDQMLQIAQFRSIETRKAIARCTTTGISAFISPTGKILKLLEVNGELKEVSGILTSNIQVHKGQSIYVQLGDWFAFLCFGLFILMFFYWWLTKKEITVNAV
jgi:apolipoprotein N-acyltransferase